MSSRTAPHVFVDQVRYALRHIYDPTCLAESELHTVLRLDKSRHPYAALQAALLSAIDDLEPEDGVPRESAAWRSHHLLYERYVEQIPLADIALDLTVGMRQLRRLNAEAISSLADYLWTLYVSADPNNQSSPGSTADSALTMAPVDMEPEIERLAQIESIQSIPLPGLIESVLDTVEPLLAQEGARVQRLQNGPSHLSVSVQMPATRHALIGLLSVGSRLAAGGVMTITVETTEQQAHVRIESRGRNRAERLGAQDRENLAIAQELLALSSGSLEVYEDSPDSSVGLDIGLPLAERVPVLVVDDNVDWLRLFQRCLAHSRYRFIGVADPGMAVTMTLQHKPQIIILDLMLPESDGWEVLGRLKVLPGMADVPIIICTILPHKDLALALGAADLVRKPFTQESLLHILDQQVSAEDPRSR